MALLCFGWRKLSYIFRWFVNIMFPGSVGRYEQLYPILERSKIAPPNWLYYMAWPAAYLLFGLGFECIRASTNNGYRSVLLLLCIMQIVLNLIHSFIFFGLGRIFHTSAWLLGMITTLALITTSLCYVADVRTFCGQHQAFWFFIPYTGWLIYTCLIQRDIMRFGLY